MPKRLPSPSTRSPVSMAAWAARPPERSTGIVPVPRMKFLTRKPLRPLPVKYSALATNVTFRLTMSGMKIESENDRWLLAMIAGPWSGTFSRPSTCGRKISRSQGPSSTYLSRLYSNPVLSRRSAGQRLRRSGLSLRSTRSPSQRTPATGRSRVTIHPRLRWLAGAGREEGAVSSGGGRRGRRDNGLVAAAYAPAGDVDPRLGEHLLDVLAVRGIAAYLQPASDLHPVTRTTTLPSRPTDRLFVDREHVETARGFVAQLADESRQAEPDTDQLFAGIVADFDTTAERVAWPAAQGLDDEVE